MDKLFGQFLPDLSKKARRFSKNQFTSKESLDKWQNSARATQSIPTDSGQW